MSEPQLDAHVGRTLGDYRLIRLIGRGAMGSVYEAEQLSLGRRVALKLLASQIALSPQGVERFRREAMLGAYLKHPRLVGVRHAGADRGDHFIVMDLIEGGNVSDLIRRLRQTREQAHRETDNRQKHSTVREASVPEGPAAPPAASLAGSSSESLPGEDPTVSHFADPDADSSAARDAPGESELKHWMSSQGDAKSIRDYFRVLAGIALDAAEGLAHAHAEGVVHRDVKPSNLLLNHEGHCLVSDFGLAKLEGQHDLTHTGQIVGTMDYLSPEQASGRNTVDERADVYSFGVTLYHLFTLQKPYTLTSLDTALLRDGMIIRPRPRRREKALPRALEQIICRAIEFKPEDRYQRMSEICEDLRSFLADEPPVHGRPPSIYERVSRTVRDNARTALLAGLGLLVMTACGLFGAVLAASLLTQERDRNRVLSAELLAARSALKREEDPFVAVRLARESLQMEASPEGRQALLAAQDENHQLAQWSVGFPVGRTLFSPNGTQALLLPSKTLTTSEASSSPAARGQLWRVLPQPQVIATYSWEGVVEDAEFTSQGDRIVALLTGAPGEANGARVVIVDAENGREIAVHAPARTNRLEPQMLARDGRVAVPDGKQVRILDASFTGNASEIPYPGDAVVVFAAFNHAGDELAAVASDGSLTRWDVRNRRQPVVRETRRDLPQASPGKLLKYSPDDRWLAVVAEDRVTAVDLQGEFPIAQQAWPGDLAWFLPDSRRLMVAERFDRHLHVYDLASGQMVHHDTLPGRLDVAPLREPAIDRNRERLLLHSGLVDLRDATTLLAIRTERALRDGAGDLAPDGEHVLAVTQDSQVQLWRVSSGRSRAAFEHVDLGGVSPPEAGDWLNEREFALPVAREAETHVLSRDGRSLSSGAGALPDRTRLHSATEFFPTATADKVIFHRLEGDRISVFNSAVAARPARLQFDSESSTVIYLDAHGRLWRWRAPDSPGPLTTPEGVVADLALARGGQQYAVGFSSGEVQLWSADRKMLARWQYDEEVNRIQYLPDNSHLLVVLASERARLQPLQANVEAVELADGDGYSDWAPSHDGKYILAWQLSGLGQDRQAVCFRRDGSVQSRLSQRWDHMNLEVDPAGHSALAFDLAGPGGAVLWDFVESRTTPIAQKPVRAAAFLPDGRILTAEARLVLDPRLTPGAAANEGDSAPLLEVWERQGARVSGSPLPVGDVNVLMPLGEQVLAGCDAYNVGLYGIDAPRPRLTLGRFAARISSLAASPQGDRLAVASLDHRASIWSSLTGERLVTLPGQAQPATWIEFDASGDRVLTVAGTTIQVWNAANGEKIRDLEGHEDVILQARFTAAGIVSESRDGVIRWWSEGGGSHEQSSDSGGYVDVSIAANGAVLACPGPARIAKASTDVAQLAPDPASRPPSRCDYFPPGGAKRLAIPLDRPPQSCSLNDAGMGLVLVGPDRLVAAPLQGDAVGQLKTIDVSLAQRVAWIDDQQFIVQKAGGAELRDAEGLVYELPSAVWLPRNSGVSRLSGLVQPPGADLLGVENKGAAWFRKWPRFP